MGILGAVPAWSASQPLPSSTLDQIRALQDDKGRRTPLERKLDSQLLHACRQHRGQLPVPGAEHLNPRLHLRQGDDVLLDFKADVTLELLQEIRRLGGRILNSFPQHKSIRAWMPLASIEPVAALPGVQKIRPADEAMTHSGSLVSQGDITHRADFARQNYSATGIGVRIGILSDSVDHMAASQAAGELPPKVNVLPGQAGAGVGEGTAMLEIVHDLAPDAELYFASAFSGAAAFAENIRALYAAGCRIIADDVTYFGESPFQDGVIAQAVNDVSAGGALFFSAAANSGNVNDGSSSVWEGDFKDGGPATFARGGRLHDFGGSTFNVLNAGGNTRRLDMFWADPLGKSGNDYDLFVVDAAGNVVASSTNIQDGNDDPYETISTVTEGQRVVIVKVSGSSRFLWLSAGRMRLGIATQGTVRGHNATGATNAFCVAATWVKSPAVPFTGGADNPVEFFSSGGPRRMFFNADGTAITPGNFSSTGGVVLQKPDITAADGVTTSVPGFAPFFGTSAAAPHAAAIAGLLWSFNPTLTPAQIRTLLTSTALDIEAPGIDRDSGAGIIMAPAAIEAAPMPPPRLFLTSNSVGGGNGNNSLDANECAQVFVELRNRIPSAGSPATGVTATLRSLVPQVVADPTPVPFPDVPANGFATNTVPFLVSTLPSFICNQTVPMELVIHSQNASTATQQLSLLVTPPGVAPATPFESAQVPLTVPDLGTVESEVTVSGITLPLAHLSVSTFLQHPYVSDLTLTLIAPDGSTAELSTRNGNDGDNYGTSCSVRTVFDDDAATPLALATAPFNGLVRPQQPLTGFIGWQPNQVNGVWKLRISDVAEPDSGLLNCWSLNVSTIQCQDGGGICFEPPQIVAQPLSTTVTNGGSAQFKVVATGTGPLSYTWFRSGTNRIASAQDAVLTLNPVIASDAGLYSVEVSNKFGRVVSDAATLNILFPPSIVSQPASQTVTNGTPTSLSVIAFGSAPLTYQWFVNNSTPLTGETNATLSFATTTPASGGVYKVQVSNPYGSLFSSPATITVVDPPQITLQPLSITNNQGATITFNSGATGTPPLHLQWWFNETVALTNATNQSLTLSSITGSQSGSYQLVVTSPYGRAASLPATLKVIVPNTPPQISLTSPASGQTFASTNLPVTIAATASDPGGQVVSVDLISDNQVLSTSTNAPYKFLWVEPTAGTHQIKAIATDNLGARATSSVAQITVTLPASNTVFLVTTGAVWRYLDTGVFPGTNWMQNDFDDGAWLAGPAELGYGDTTDGRPEATVIRFGSNANNRFITYYFRRAFEVSDPSAYTNLLVRLMRDDGGAVYLNGLEVFRSNLPNGTLLPTTLASSTVNGSGEAQFFSTNVNPALLKSGLNVIAVEIHQVTANSTDVSFDLELRGTRVLGPRFITQPESLTVNAGQPAEFSAQVLGPLPMAFQWYFNRSNRLAGATDDQFTIDAATVPQSGNYTLVASNAFGSATSSPALLTVIPPITNRPPSVVWNSPTNNSVINAATLPLLLRATASDPENKPLSVRFLADGAVLSTQTTPPFEFSWANPGLGAHQLAATATDDGGLTTTSAVVQIQIQAPSQDPISLIKLGAVWSYDDTGTDLGSNWVTTSFNDASWKTGPAELGYGDTADGRPEATVISFGPSSTSKYPTAYFRKSFVLSNPETISALRFQLLRDDGAAVYLNGIEQFRDNLPSGVIRFTNLALTAINNAAETNLVINTITNPPLRVGTNVIAVEVHQNVRNSSDLSFDLAIDGFPVSAPRIVLQPSDQTVTNGGIARFSVNAVGANPLAYQWWRNQTNRIQGATLPSLELTNVQPDIGGLYSCTVSNVFGLATSASALLKVLDPANNLPPTVALTAPSDGTTRELGTTISLSATASDPDGQIVSVRFFDGASQIGTSTSLPYSGSWQGAGPGQHLLTALATDNLGAVATSAPVRIQIIAPTRVEQILVSTGAVWKYNDKGISLGNTWRRTDFNDSAWSSGPALLGFGNAAKGRPEATVLNAGTLLLQTPTFYFRRLFTLTNTSLINSLELRLLRDDGAAIYINNIRVVRDNLPSGTPAFTTLATAPVTGADETRYFTNIINPANFSNLLIVGTNQIAVEVHQASPTGDDLAFDLGLTALLNSPPVILAQPSDLSVTNGGSASLKVVAIGSAPLTYQWFFQTNTPVVGATGPELLLNPVGTNQAGNYSVVVQNGFGTNRSRQAQLTVIVPPPNHPPTVALLSPTNGATYLLGTAIPLSATASDADGPVQSVSILDGSQEIVRLTNSPYLFDWISATGGTHTLRAAAVDAQGATSTTAPISIQVLIPPPPPSETLTLVSTGSVWKYLDTGTNLGTAWRDPSFDDSAWPAGNAELGFGDGVEGRPEATQLQPGPSGNRTVTFYFRSSFVVNSLASLTELSVQLMRDDGGVVYLNGTEIFRSNMPTGLISSVTVASTVVGKQDEYTFFSTNVPLNLLRSGTNYLAVEIHQANLDSSDISFDLELDAKQLSMPIIQSDPKDLTVIEGNPATFTVGASGAAPLRYQWFLNGLNPIPNATNATLLIPSAESSDEGSYSVEVSNDLGNAVSGVGLLKVLTKPRIVTEPLDQEVALDGTAVFQVAASGTPPLTYRWFFGTTELVGRTNPVIQITPVKALDAGPYVAVVSNPAGSITSRVALLQIPAVSTPVAFLSQPQPVTVVPGAPASFAATVSGTGPIVYEWFFNITNVIPGATNATFNIPAATEASMGLYSIKAANGFSAVTSAPVELRVLVKPSILALSAAPPGPLALTFSSLTRLRYTVEFTDTMPVTNWVPVSGAIQIKGTGNAITVGDPTADPFHRFYRIRVE